jgi:hypothetical protein
MQHALPRREIINWTGWQTRGDKLYTPNGDYVNQGDILALPSLRMALRETQRELKQFKPPPEPRAPLQLTLPHVPPIWRVKAT